MTWLRGVSRRAFLIDLGRGSIAAVALGAGACGKSSTPAERRASSSPKPSSSSVLPPSESSTAGPPGGAGGLSYRRVELGSGFVSAFVLVRGEEAAIVDTGIERGDVEDIGRAVGAAGRQWDDVRHVILTHSHYDHVGSLTGVVERAARATVYAGAADIPAIRSPRKISPVGDGDEVFGFRVIETPGHTPGHIAVLDPLASVLLIGDALFNTQPLRPLDNVDDDEANASVRKLAALDFETVLFGHGEPIVQGADAAVRDVAERL
ncbi:MAG: MBL fold metallo-hydrolase [Acidimicrobiia bacterium]